MKPKPSIYAILRDEVTIHFCEQNELILTTHVVGGPAIVPTDDFDLQNAVAILRQCHDDASAAAVLEYFLKEELIG